MHKEIKKKKLTFCTELKGNIFFKTCMFFCIPCSNTKILFSKNRKEREVFCFVYSYYEWKPYQHSLFKIRTLYIPLGVDWGSVLGRYCSYSVLRNFGSEIRSENSYLTNLQQVTLREKKQFEENMPNNLLRCDRCNAKSFASNPKSKRKLA